MSRSSHPAIRRIPDAFERGRFHFDDAGAGVIDSGAESARGNGEGGFLGSVQKLSRDMCAAVADLKAEVLKNHNSTGERMQALEAAMEAVKRQQNAMPVIPIFGEFDPYRLKYSEKEADGGREMFNQLLQSRPSGSPTMQALVEELQRSADEFYIVSAFKRLDHVSKNIDAPGMHELSELRSAKKYNRMLGFLRNALDTATSGEGQQWVPTGMSAQVIAKVALDLRIASQFGSFPMPTPSYDWPFQTALPVAKNYSQTTGFADPFPMVQGDMAFGAGEPTGKVTFEAKKIRCLQVITREFNEDAILPVMTWLINQIAYGIASGWDDAVQNGDTAGTHFDNHVTGSTNVRKTIDGLRDYVLGVGGLGQSLGTVDMGGVAPTTIALRRLRSKMGVFGTMLDRLFYVCSTIGAIHFLNIEEVMTADKYGPGATIQTGELAKFDGSPIIPSGYWPDNVSATGANTVGGPNTFTSIGLVWKPNFLWGTRPGLGVETERIKLTDQSFAIMYDRKAFKYVGAVTDPVVTLLRNIPNTI